MSGTLVTGAKGQIGSDLVAALRARHGEDAVVATDIRPGRPSAAAHGPYEVLDVRDADRLRELVERHEPETVFHLASLLSATGERQPDVCWQTNTEGLRNVLELARSNGLRVFWPSSIAVFGPGSPRDGAPQSTVLDPTTMYGITKVAGELLCRYYADRYDVDVRSVRFPGIISHNARPGGGTTDYAIDMFYAALEQRAYTCFVEADCRLPMIYMPDAVRSILEIMDAEPSAITVRTSYNLAGVSFAAAELEAEIRRHVPGFECRYEPDFRARIAESWPAAVDDSAAREDWGWRHQYGLAGLVEDMFDNLSRKLAGGRDRAGAARGRPTSTPT